MTNVCVVQFSFTYLDYDHHHSMINTSFINRCLKMFLYSTTLFVFFVLRCVLCIENKIKKCFTQYSVVDILSSKNRKSLFYENICTSLIKVAIIVRNRYFWGKERSYLVCTSKIYLLSFFTTHTKNICLSMTIVSVCSVSVVVAWKRHMW